MGSREQLTKSFSDLPKWESHSSCIRYVCNKVIPVLRDENAEPEDGLADRQEGSVRPRPPGSGSLRPHAELQPAWGRAVPRRSLEVGSPEGPDSGVS